MQYNLKYKIMRFTYKSYMFVKITPCLANAPDECNGSLHFGKQHCC